MNKKLMTTALSSVLAMSALAGCSGSGGDAKQILRFGVSGFEGAFNPIISSNVYDAWVCDLIFEGLVNVDPEGGYVGELAQDGWVIDEDKHSYTFTLKDGIKFSDGTDLTTADVEFTYNTIKEADYAGPRTAVGAAIEKMNVIDDKTIEFVITPNDFGPAAIENFTYGIISKEHYQHSDWQSLNMLNEKPLGSGIMTLDSWAAKQNVILVKNENYWDAANAAKIDGVNFVNIEEDATLLASLANGEIDFCQLQAKKENVEEVGKTDGIHLVSYLANGYTYMAFNTARPQLNQKEVRQALLYALDRPSFLKQEYGADELAALGMAPISKTSWAYPGDDELNAYSYDLDKANKLLDDAGWTERETVTRTDGSTIECRKNANGDLLQVEWLVYPEATWPTTLSGLAFDSWGQIGVNLIVKQMDFNTVSATTKAGNHGEKNFDIYTMGFSLSVDPDPTGGLFDGDSIDEGSYNCTSWRDERSQELMIAGKQEFDQAKRAEIYKEWAKIQNENVPTAIVAYRAEIWGISDKVSGLDDIGVYTDWTSLVKNVTIAQ